MEYDMPSQIAKQIAVGLYQQIGALLAVEKRENPADFENFKSNYIAKQTQSPANVRRRYYIRKHSVRLGKIPQGLYIIN